VTPAPAEPRTTPAYGRISAIGAVLVVLLAALLASAPPWHARLQGAWFDACQRLFPRRVHALPVTVVAIDEASLRRYGQWPWPRSTLAALVRAIERQRPAAIGLDILMPEPDRLSPERVLADVAHGDPSLAPRIAALPSNDDALARALADARVVVPIAGIGERGTRDFTGPPVLVIDRAGGATAATATRARTYAGALVNIAAIDRAAAGHGVISAGRAGDVVRRMPMVVRIGDRFAPSLALELLRVALEAPAVRILADGPSIEAVAVGGFVVPTEGDGAVRLHFAPRSPERIVAAADVLDGRIDAARLDNQIVLVGADAVAIGDYQATPLGRPMPGTEIHAQLIENLVGRSTLARPAYAPLAEAGLFVALGLMMAWVVPRWKPLPATLAAAGIVAVPVVAGLAAFAFGRLVFDAAGPAIALALLFAALQALTLADARRVRGALQRIVQEQRRRAAYVAGELDAAKRIQAGYLPTADALRDETRVEVAAAMIPARDVGGDLYDFFRLDDDRVFFMIGDVSGKGLSSSLFMAVSKALCKSVVLRNPAATAGDIVRAASAEISRDNGESLFVAACVCTLDLARGELGWCNAGHENPYLLRADDAAPARLADGGGPPLCVVDGFDYEGASRRLAAGDVVLLVTDGVADAVDRNGTPFGAARLAATIARWRAGERSARALVDAVCADVRAFEAGAEAADDVTVLAVRWNGPAAATRAPA
jgi:serine phosphatase RsbU (regulator of sigma subunit)/CHASE2 domain-containing sensor protein